jgi:hypothetical protein
MVRGSFAKKCRTAHRRLPAFYMREANLAATIVRDEVRDRTPIGRVVDPETGRDLGPSGRLKNSVKRIRPKKVPGNRIVTGAYSPLSYANDVEGGTSPHVIKPKRGIVKTGPKAGLKRRENVRFWSQGTIHFAQQVNHPGMPGHHMFARGLQAARVRYKGGVAGRLSVVFR